MKNSYACIGLFNPKSPENVGSVMRAAGCYGINSVFYTGKRYDYAKPFYTDTQKI
jgi:tRNA(Leu) C34 or U34 (ribose-2'-O)-methylase TrmL